MNHMSRRRKILIVAGVVLGVAILIPVIRHYQLRCRDETYIAELKAKGEPMELAQVIPPPVPPEQNAAPLITNALSQIHLESNYTNAIYFKNPPGAMNRIIPGKEMVGWHQPVIHTSNTTWPPNLTNTWDDLGAQLSERLNNLNYFRKLIKNPKFDFNYDYSDPKMYIPVLAPHLSQIKMAFQWLDASEYYNLHQDKTADACTDIRTMLAFIKGQTDERFEISQLIRFAIASISASATWDILQTTNVSDADLAQLQQDWQSLEFIAPLKKAFLFERLSELQLLKDLRQSPTNLDGQVAWTQFTSNMNNEHSNNDERFFFQKTKDGIATQWDKFQWRWSVLHGRSSVPAKVVGCWSIGANTKLETNRSFQSVQSIETRNWSDLGISKLNDEWTIYIRQDGFSSIMPAVHVRRAEYRKG